MENLSDRDIRAAVTEKGFKKLYDFYSPFVWRVAFRSSNGNREISAQIVQSVFITISRNLKKFKFKSLFSTWIYQITWREAISTLKKVKKAEKRDVQLTGDEKGKSESFYGDESVEHILGSLMPEERFLLVSRELDGISFSELSKITKKSEGALRVLLSRIKSKLREELNYER